MLVPWSPPSIRRPFIEAPAAGSRRPAATVAAFNQRFWRGLCAAIGRPDLADDPRFASLRERQRHRDALMAELSALFAPHTSQHWSERLDAHDVPNGPVLDVLTLLDHPWVDERRLLRPVPTPDGGTVRVSRQPVVYGSEPPPVAPAAPAPELGQHTTRCCASGWRCRRRTF